MIEPTELRRLWRAEDAEFWNWAALGLWSAFAALMAADVVSTLVAVEYGMTEGNPLVRHALDAGALGLATVKIAALVAGYVIWSRAGGSPRSRALVLVPPGVLYLGVVANNVAWLLWLAGTGG